MSRLRTKPERHKDRLSAWVTVLDLVLVAAVLGALFFPFAAELSVIHAGVEPDAPQLELPALQLRPSGVVRDVPVFTPGSAAQSAVADQELLTDRKHLDASLVDADRRLTGGKSSGLLRIARTPSYRLEKLFKPEIGTFETTPYPFQHPVVDRLLNRLFPLRMDLATAAAANDEAGLLMIANARDPDRYPNGAATAYALLLRARESRQCLPQLNLAFLLSTEDQARDDDTVAEFDQAERICEGDPTPLWLLGQFQSARRSYLLKDWYFDAANSSPGTPAWMNIERLGQVLPFAERVRRPFETFHRLEEKFPGLAEGWAGEADAYLRLAYALQTIRPFSARIRFRRALALYQRATTLGGGAEALAGQARAYAGLGRLQGATTIQKRAVELAPGEMPLEVRLIEYLEKDRRFLDAARLNAQFLGRTSRYPIGPGLFARGADDYGEDAGGPLSTGATRLDTVVFTVGSPPGGAGGSVQDLSFIPLYRQSYGVTGYDRWCRDWTRRRDLILAGHPEEALEGFPTQFLSAIPPVSTFFSTSCQDTGPLKAVGLAEAGRMEDAIEFARSAGVFYGEEQDIVAQLNDARQNLWRFAGDLAEAAEAADDWLFGSPDDAVAFDRRGEIAFLQHQYARSAGLFLQAADQPISADLDPFEYSSAVLAMAQARLKAGVAMHLAGRTLEGQRQLKEAASIAMELIKFGKEHEFEVGEAVEEATVVLYHAHAQAGDAALRVRRYEEARAQFLEARRARAEILSNMDQPEIAPFRSDVLDNNLALVDIKLNRDSEALDTARLALAADPTNPLYLQTMAFAEQEAGHLERAVTFYEKAVRIEPTLFPAENDRGVLLWRLGKPRQAELAFRHVVGINPRFAVGWFNLGVALKHRGLAHILESQGAFGRAFRLESSLRDAKYEPILDSDLYFTTLDLSKPVPPTWSFAESQARMPVAVSVFVFALILARLAWGVFKSHLEDWGVERLLHFARKPRMTGLRIASLYLTPWAAVAVTALVFLRPVVSPGGLGVVDALLLVVGALTLVGIYVRVRIRAAVRRQLSLRHFSWPPSIVLGLITTVLMVGWTPLPVAKPSASDREIRLTGVGVLGGAMATLLLIGWLTQIPATRALGQAALVMTASLLIPVEPYDGAYLGQRLSTLLGLSLIGISGLLGAGIM